MNSILRTIKYNYGCKKCDYATNRRTDFDRHILSKKHKMNLNLPIQQVCGIIEKQNTAVNAQKNKSVSSPIIEKGLYPNIGNNNIIETDNIHINQHTLVVDNSDTATDNNDTQSDNDNETEQNNSFVCECGHYYTKRSNLSRHQKNCEIFRAKKEEKNYLKQIQDTEHITNIIYTDDTTSVQEQDDDNASLAMTNTSTDIMPPLTASEIRDILNSLLDEKNGELKTLIQEHTQQVMEKNIYNINNGNINNINNNNNYNLNIFLHQYCKDAISIGDFIKNHLKIDTKSVEYTGRRGYVEGMTKIFMDGLKKLDIRLRPIHCTDVKREIFYIKGDDKWEKDDEHQTKIKKAIDTVMWMNVGQVSKWQKENPACDVVNSPEYEFHLVVMRQSIGGGNSSDHNIIHRNNEKIIKNLAKAVHLDRKKMKCGFLPLEDE